MQSAEFVSNVVKLKHELLDAFVGEHSTSEVALLIASLGLTPEQHHTMNQVINAALRDTLYTFLLGLDGAAAIGNIQQSYSLTAEDGSLVYEPGELEAEAWRQLHNDA